MSKKENVSLKEAVECLRRGGKAWDGSGNGIFLDDCGFLVHDDSTVVPVSSEQATLNVFAIEEKEPEVDYVDVVPLFVEGICVINYKDFDSTVISSAINHCDFLGYVFDDGDKEILLNVPVMYKHHGVVLHEASASLQNYELVWCKAVRFRK